MIQHCGANRRMIPGCIFAEKSVARHRAENSVLRAKNKCENECGSEKKGRKKGVDVRVRANGQKLQSD
jgi:hypothetical protein